VALIFLPIKSVYDLFVNSDGDWIRYVTVRICLCNSGARFLEISFMDQPTWRFGAISLAEKGVIEVERAYIKGRMIIQSREKIPWNSEGSLHAQVEFHP
jgi:hypothetical protein